MLVRILEEMAQGNSVSLTPVHADLTTQEAADLLNISRPSPIQLPNEGNTVFTAVALGDCGLLYRPFLCPLTLGAIGTHASTHCE
jgi:hypothetical protein